MRFTIRRFRPDDFRRLWEIDQSCFARGIAYTQFELKSYIRRPKAFTIVAELELEQETTEDQKEPDRILGFLIAEHGPNTGHIITLDVRQSARRHRVGSKLLESAEHTLKMWNCGKIRLETAVDNINALTFYKRHGYNVSGTIPRYYSNGVDALLLEKELHSQFPTR